MTLSSAVYAAGGVLTPPTPALRVRGLSVTFQTRRGPVRAAADVDLDIARGQLVALLGESGSGKSVTARAVMGLHAGNADVRADELVLAETDLLSLSEEQRRRFRGSRMSLVFQDALSALNPVLSIGDQIGALFREHEGASRRQARRRAVEMLKLVGIPGAARRVADYPHQFSGGMRQRILIAMAIALKPELLIADEPTTALDVTVQAQILELLDRLRRELSMAVLLITHDLGVVSEVADQVAVMYAGRIVESGTADALFDRPAHPYTGALLRSVPQVEGIGEDLVAIPGSPPNPARLPTGCPFIPGAAGTSRSARPSVPNSFLCATADSRPATEARRCSMRAADEVVLEARDLHKTFTTGRGGLSRTRVSAVDGISLDLRRGEALGIVGESGCGKSTLARLLVGLEVADSGEIVFQGANVARARGERRRRLRQGVQMVFQDPYTSLDPRMTVLEIVGEPLATQRGGPGRAVRRSRVEELLALVGLAPDMIDRYPHQFSGGQRQRIGIARALALEPDVLVCDEPVSALDVSVQAQVVNLLHDLRRRMGIALLFIAHDLSVVRHVCDRVAVMYLGRLAETGDTSTVYTAPAHPYTQALLSASPVVDRTRRGRMASRIVLAGDPPSPTDPPAGCRFHTRCRMAQERCAVEQPALRHPSIASTIETGADRLAACHFAEAALERLDEVFHTRAADSA